MPKNLKIYFPFKPYVITQHWGASNPAYAAQFNDPQFKAHNGTDANIGKIDPYTDLPYSEYPVYCPVEGFTVKSVDFSPQGGGNELWLISNEPVQMFDKLCYAWIPLCHAKKVLVKAGDKPELGELLMIADNTGFSTGIHTHMGLYRVDYMAASIHKLDQNDAEGSFSPELFFTGEYAVDKATTSALVKSGLKYVKYKLGL
jgi:hypothetical protein